MRARTRCWIRLLMSGLALILAGCSREAPKVQVEKTRPLPEVSAGEQNFSAYKPENPYREMAPMLLTRTVFQAPGPPGYRVEVRDLRLAAHKKADDITLPGAAFAEVHYGTGNLSAGERRQELSLGTTLSISQGQRFSLESTSDQPLIIRIHLLAAE